MSDSLKLKKTLIYYKDDEGKRRNLMVWVFTKEELFKIMDNYKIDKDSVENFKIEGKYYPASVIIGE